VKTRKALDSYALLAYLQGEDGSPTVKEALLSGEGEVLMNEVNIGEVYYILARSRGRDRADYFLKVILPSLPIRAVGNDFEMVIAAARIKADYPLSYADCFAVATARRERATLLTGDSEFHAVSSLVDIDWI